MFEKIIEKIETEKIASIECGHFDSSINLGLEKAIKILQKENDKPFNPEDFGFRLYGEASDYQTNFIKEIENESYGSFNIWLKKYGTQNHYYAISRSPYDIAPSLINNAKINTYLEGRIILKSLGIIKNENDR